MSRWFAATVLAIMLSCYGFAVFAQGMVGAGHAGGETPACVTSVSLSDALAANDAMDASDELASHDEAGSEHAELVDARYPAPAPLLLSEQPRGLALTSTLSPLLERPKRPPRGSTALVA
jgi:hypothetical protein